MTTYSVEYSNLFAYCQNNPVAKADDNGEIAHIVVGGIIGCATSLISGVLEGKEGVDLIVSVVFGTASGALSAALPGMGALIDIGFSIADSVYTGIRRNDSFGRIVADATISAMFSAVSSTGGGYFTSRSTYDQLGEAASAFSQARRGNHPNVRRSAQRTVRRVGINTVRAGAIGTSKTAAVIAAKYALMKKLEA